jgi:four helix bundle protein
MSVGANYRAVTRSRSNAEFIAKVGIVIEEADEALFWLEALSETGVCSPEPIHPLTREGNELLSILVAAQRTARTRRNDRASHPRPSIRKSQLGKS